VPRKKHSPDEIIRKLRQAEVWQNEGQTIAQVCQKLEVSEQTFHRWRQTYGGMKADEMKRLKELEISGTSMIRFGRRTKGGVLAALG
jgi:transposase-like protein